jgi:glucose-1-phosphate thymidylyltransferase
VEAVPSGIFIIVSTNAAFAKDFAEWKKTLRRDVTVSIEDAGHEDQKLGALGAVARWIETEKIDDDVLLLAGDNFAAFSLEKFLGLARGNPLLAAHDIGDPELAKQFGTVITEGDDAIKKVTSFEEKPAHPKSTFVSTGWWILPKHTLPVLQEYAKEHPDNVGGIFEEFLRRNIAVDCFVFPELWKDIGSFEAYMSLHRAIVGEKSLVDAQATVDKESALKGSIDLGPKTRIEKSTLTDCILFGNSVIRDCVLERCIVDEGCKLEGIDLTDQMVRAGTVMKL